MVIFPDTNSFYCFTCKFGSKPEDLVAHLDKCSKQEALSKVYGDNYLKDALDTTVVKKEHRYPLRLLLSKQIQEELKTRKIPNLLTHLKWLDTVDISSKNIHEIIDTIKGWN